MSSFNKKINQLPFCFILIVVVGEGVLVGFDDSVDPVNKPFHISNNFQKMSLTTDSKRFSKYPTQLSKWHKPLHVVIKQNISLTTVRILSQLCEF